MKSDLSTTLSSRSGIGQGSDTAHEIQDAAGCGCGCARMRKLREDAKDAQPSENAQYYRNFEVFIKKFAYI